MFTFLLVIGLGFIVLGIYLNKREINFKKINSETSHDGIGSILMRLDSIEKILFDTDINDEVMKHEKNYTENSVFAKEIKQYQQNILSSAKIDDDVSGFSPAALEKYKKILKMENDNYTMEIICKELGMSKGEVILLKNLFKDY